MSCWEVDIEGHVKVYVFVVYTVCKKTNELLDDNALVKEFTDYTEGWNWARQTICEIEENDPDYNNDNAITGKVVIDSYWLEDD